MPSSDSRPNPGGADVKRRAGAALAMCLVATSSALAGCASTITSPIALDYLGRHQESRVLTADGGTGGLSAVSYDPEHDVFYLAGLADPDAGSATPSADLNPGFHVTRMRLHSDGVRSVQVLRSHSWTTVSGTASDIPSINLKRWIATSGAEAIAADPRRNRLYWSSAGEPMSDGENPTIRVADIHGLTLGTFTLPRALRASGSHRVRADHTLTGLALTPTGRWLWAAMRDPLLQDGPLPTPARGALTRITRFDPDTRTATAQYAYPLDPSTGAESENGLSDLLALDDSSFLAVERGSGPKSARIFHATVGDADNVLDRPALDGQPVRVVTKTKVLDFAAEPGLPPLGRFQGVTLGPVLPDGRQSVMLVSADGIAGARGHQVLTFALRSARCEIRPHIRGYQLPQFSASGPKGTAPCHTHETPE